MSSLLTPLLAASAVEPRPALGAVALAVAPAALGIAVVLVLLTAVAVVALVIEVRRDGYGIERPRPISTEFPWQSGPVARRRRLRRRRESWPFLRVSRTVHR